MFAQTSHEYLIHQVQFNLFQGLSAGPNYLETTFMHPVKEIFWVLTRDDLDLTNNWYNFTGLQGDDARSLQYWQSQQPYYNYPYFNNSLLTYINSNFTPFINSIKNQSINKLTTEQTQTYFGNFYSIMQSAQPLFNNNDRMEIENHAFYENMQVFKYHDGIPPPGVYVLSFALNPQDIQPSGTQNFSRLDYQEFRVNIFNTFPVNEQFNCYMFAINYNVLRIIGGIGSTVFSN
jgi:hypothetical protein